MQDNKPQNLICEIIFGSHLYGTATEKSDRDFKGIFLPTPDEICLGRIPKTKSSTSAGDKKVPGELDCEYYSLHHFVRLAAQGQLVAIDMLFAPENCVFKSEKYGWVWDSLLENRHLFLSKRMSAFIGYARSQASKYSLKGDRLKRLVQFGGILSDANHVDMLDTVWGQLPKDAHRTNPQGIRELQIGGKWFGATTPIHVVYGSVVRSLKNYGDRAHQAAKADGADWKALSHAVRASKELIELLGTGNIIFPLSDAPLLLRIKRGELSLEEVGDILDGDLHFIEAQMEQSRLPEAVDMKFWDSKLSQVVQQSLRLEAKLR